MSAMQRNLRKIVIAGGQVTGWTVAAGLANSLAGSGTQIILIELPVDGDDEQVATAFSQAPAFHRHLGIDEFDLMRKTYGTFKLGTRYENWRRACPQFFLGYDSAGATLGVVRFHQFLSRMRAGGEETAYGDFSLAAEAARLGRFALPGDDSKSVPGRLAYAVQLDGELYARYLREYALRHGVSTVAAGIAGVSVRDSNGFIAALELDSGDTVAGDFFVDCSGSRGFLIDGALRVPFDDWGDWLPCDRALAVTTRKARNPDPYARCIAKDGGWLQRTVLQHATIDEFVYSSRYLDERTARAALHESLEGVALSRVFRRSFRAGMRQRVWERNCLAFGRAAGGFEPLETTGLRLLQNGLLRFLGMLPDRSANARLATEFNRIVRRQFESARDFLLLRYRLADVAGGALWDHPGFRQLPPELQRRIDLFQSRGRFVDEEYDIFSLESWVSLLLGNGVKPSGYDPLADGIDALRLTAELTRIRTAVREAAKAMPPHHAFIMQHCAAGGGSDLSN